MIKLRIDKVFETVPNVPSGLCRHIRHLVSLSSHGRCAIIEFLRPSQRLQLSADAFNTQQEIHQERQLSTVAMIKASPCLGSNGSQLLCLRLCL